MMDPSSHNGNNNYNQQYPHHTHKASPATLLSSAKVIAEAAQSTLRHDAHGYDKTKAAGAAADLLCAGSHYAKLDESGAYGKYVEKAENYLHQYNNHHNSSAAPAHSSSAHPGAATAAPGSAGGGGGYGDYVKMAQGFMGNSSTNDHDSSGEGGYGDYVNMAQGFFKKH